MIVWLRSIAFGVTFFSWTLFCALLFLPIFILPQAYGLIAAKIWTRGVFWICDHILHLHVKINGLEKLPQTSVILASKHQSAWETLFFHCFLPGPAIVLKRELLWIPFFGWYLKKAGVIPLSRSKRKGSQDLKKLLQGAHQVIDDKRQILIFPEGTRSKPGQKGTYHSGVTSLYLHLNIPVVPIALNSGVYWPRRGFLKYPGTITLEFRDPIYPGLSRQDFMKELENTIESRTNELVREALIKPRVG